MHRNIHTNTIRERVRMTKLKFGERAPIGTTRMRKNPS